MTTRIAVVQTSPLFGKKERNIADALGSMASVDADLYVLPELFATGYHFANNEELLSLAEPPEGPTFSTVAAFARKRGCFVCYGFAEGANPCYNSSALVGPDGMIGFYRKTHLFSRETRLFAPGDLGFPVFELPFARVGMMICFDWIYPEAARTLALRGAQILLHPANLVTPYCPDAMVTRCLENRVFAATADRAGSDVRPHGSLTFIGSSQIVSPGGAVLQRLGTEQPGVAVANIDPALALNKRFNDYNDLLADRREEFYLPTSGDHA